jgi:ubiquilin
MAGLNPFADMGINPNDPNMVRFCPVSPVCHGCLTHAQLQSMMNSPEFLQQMSSLMSNPAILEQALALNPQYASMAPHAREMFQSERFRQMMLAFHFHLGLFSHAESLSRSNPETLRSMLQMASMMRGAGLDPLGGPPGGSTFTPPGNPNAPSDPNTTTPPETPGSAPTPGGTASAPNLFGTNPFGADASALLQFLGAGGPAFGGGASLGGTPPAETRPPEERFQVQLQVRTFIAPHLWIDISHLFFLIAIARYGLHECLAKCARTTCDRRKRTFSDRVYPWRWWIVVQEIFDDGQATFVFACGALSLSTFKSLY